MAAAAVSAGVPLPADILDGAVDLATGVLYSLRLGESVLQLIQAHFESIEQARLLHVQVSIISPLVVELQQQLPHMQQSSPQADAVVLAVKQVGTALQVGSASC